MNALEKHTTNLLSKLFGTNLESRFRKLNEEYNELKVESDLYLDSETNPLQKEKVIDDLSDVYMILIHIAFLLNITTEELNEMGLDKVIGRIKNPNYKRLTPKQNTPHSLIQNGESL